MLKHPQHFQLGRISRTHGLQGELVAILDTDKPHQYTKLDGFFLEINQKLIPHFIQKISIRGSEARILLEGISTIEQATKFKGAEIFLPLEKLPKPQKDEFYFHDLLGCQLEDTTYGLLGTVEDVIDASAQKLLFFHYQGKEVLLPLVKEFVTEIDLKNKMLKTSIPDGLLELYMEEPKQQEKNLQNKKS
jgi:16S rRNA processing protein RimM